MNGALCFFQHSYQYNVSPVLDEEKTIADSTDNTRSPMALSAMPRVIAKKYQVEGVIGAGGMGAVYR